MTTDHMELRKAAAMRWPVPGETEGGNFPLISVSQIALQELLHEFDLLKASPAAAGKGGYTPEFDAAWSEYPKRPGNSKAAAFKAWKASLKRGATVEQLIEATRAYAAYCKAKRTEPEYVKQAATFYGPGEHYAADWTVQPPGRVPALPDTSSQRWPFPASSQGRVPLAQQQAAANEEAKRRLFGQRPDDDNTFDMVPA